MWASYHGNVKAIEALLNHGSNLNDKNKARTLMLMRLVMMSIDEVISHIRICE
jgi:ankyrin repeat protein